ncbi:hypothetical protein J0X19_22195 [Hymenobacter sp. BT186]|uniref:REase associating with pPIWI RE domain-containing protein n=1 Tax=Hymenobacter telluris TaxID=2816474 RepID=A0A939JF66_9BACT|nr:hypothetical protein [Hymenobacter telluris]MBO0360688.1 hypothetical protein [Hymenobacter telluris]MBW3376715.1 hypothetical protein [Hymenobacter norwichensis]
MPPTERVLRKWRQEEVISRTGRRFTGRNVLEAVYTAWQRREGATLIAIASQLQTLELPQLHTQVASATEATTPAYADDRRLTQLMTLLAHGVLKQFQAVQAGRAVGVGLGDTTAATEAVIPLPLRQAQAQLARLAFEGGQVDECASVHELLWRCTKPLNEWAPLALAQHPHYADVVLIDAEYRVPSPACEDFGEEGGHLADLVENQIYRGLRQALDQLDESERDVTYTLVRRFVAEHPMVSRTGQAWRKLWASPRLNPAVREWLRFVYEPAHAALANRQGLVAQCAHCHAPLVSQDRKPLSCVLSACRATHPHPAATGEPLALADALVARPEVLRYWCNPSLDELRLFRELTALFPEEEVQLYPYQDLCDVAVGTRLGFDVKDYTDPVLLARKLNRGVGGLRLYDTMVVAVAERQVVNRPQYLPQVREHLQTALRRSLRVLSVDDILETLRHDGQLS